MLNKELSVGQLAARSGVAVTALHFYEAKGLIKSNRNACRWRRARCAIRTISSLSMGRAPNCWSPPHRLDKSTSSVARRPRITWPIVKCSYLDSGRMS